MADILTSQGRQYISPNPEDLQNAGMLMDAVERLFQKAELTIYALEGNTKVVSEEITALAGYAATNYFPVECIREQLEPLIQRCWGVRADDNIGLGEIKKLIDASIEMGLKAKKWFQIFKESACGEKRAYVL